MFALSSAKLAPSNAGTPLNPSPQISIPFAASVVFQGGTSGVALALFLLLSVMATRPLAPAGSSRKKRRHLTHGQQFGLLAFGIGGLSLGGALFTARVHAMTGSISQYLLYAAGPSGNIVIHWRPNNLAAHDRLLDRAKSMLRRAGYPILLDRQMGIATNSHQCGTVRFGHDPATSVLDPYCRAHDLDNLNVVDAGFFPSSTAVNPALTIAAQALRVGDHLRDKLGASPAPLEFMGIAEG